MEAAKFQVICSCCEFETFVDLRLGLLRIALHAHYTQKHERIWMQSILSLPSWCSFLVGGLDFCILLDKAMVLTSIAVHARACRLCNQFQSRLLVACCGVAAAPPLKLLQRVVFLIRHWAFGTQLATSFLT
jgi:hypothetical protein